MSSKRKVSYYNSKLEEDRSSSDDESQAERRTTEEEKLDYNHELNSLLERSNSRLQTSPKGKQGDESFTVLTNNEKPKVLRKKMTTERKPEPSSGDRLETSTVEKKKNMTKKGEERGPIEAEGRPMSKWASKFLMPRVIPLLDDPVIVPMNDYILAEFGERSKTEVKPRDNSVGEGNESDESSVILDDTTPMTMNEESQTNEIQHSKKAGNSDSQNAGISDESSEEGEGVLDQPGSKNKRRRSLKGGESRYFKEDISVKCFKCGQPGHRAMFCSNERLERPCYLCAVRGHDAARCPSSLCFNCCEPGHQSRECTSRRLELSFCRVCGGADHYAKDCRTVPSEEDQANIRCMACLETGHLLCVPLPVPRDSRVYCSNCGAQGHFGEECESAQYNESLVEYGLLPNPGSISRRSSTLSGARAYQPRPHERVQRYSERAYSEYDSNNGGNRYRQEQRRGEGSYTRRGRPGGREFHRGRAPRFRPY